MARLFNKNTAFRNPQKVSMEGEVCPMLVSKYPFQGVQGLVNGGNNYNSLKVIYDCFKTRLNSLVKDGIKIWLYAGKSRGRTVDVKI